MLTIDFESFYTDEYSLSKLTTEEYIRDPRFEIIGVSVQVDDQPGQWYSGDFAGVYMFLTQFDWANAAVASHNAMFDMAILGWKFNIYPRMVVDTMSMAKAIHGVERSCSLAKLAELYNLPAKGTEVHNAKGLRLCDMPEAFLRSYGEYCVHDSWLCRELFKCMRSKIPTPEMMAIDWTIQCYSRPTLRIDVPLARQALAEHLQVKSATLSSLGVTQEALRSDEVMAELLVTVGAEPPKKFSPKQKDDNGQPLEVWAFAKSDTEFMDLLEDPDPRVSALVEARLANKTSIVETRLQAFIDIGQRGALPYPLAYASAQPTLRWQAWKQQRINLQNLPRAKKDERSPLRDAIKAPPGYKLGVVDLSQIELRVNAWQSRQQSLLDLLRSGKDAYSHTATRIFARPINKHDDPAERFVGKTATLGCGFQCGGPKFALMLRVAARREGFKLADETNAFGQKCVDAFREENPMIKSFWYDAARALKVMAEGGCTTLGPYDVNMGAVMLPDGMPLYYPNLRWYVDPMTGKEGFVYDKYMGRGIAKKWVYGGLFTENITQRVARGVMRDGLLRLRQRFWVPGSVHDELIFLVPENEPEEAAMDFAIECLTQPPAWAPNLPLAAEGKIGRCYGDAK